MSTYRKIHGRSIQAVTTDPSESVAEGQVWYNTTSDTFKTVLIGEATSSQASLTTARGHGSAAGTTTAAIVAFGDTNPVPGSAISPTETWNGSGFSSSPNVNTARKHTTGFGTATSALFAGGPGGAANVETYDGSSFSETTDLNTGRGNLGASSNSPQTAGLVFGGEGPPATGATELWNGSSWSEQPDLNTARTDGAGAGISTSALYFGGEPTPANGNKSEEYNGSTWAATPNLNTNQQGNAGAGANADSALSFGGPPPAPGTQIETFDGTSWTTSPATLATARYNIAGCGTTSSTLAAGGFRASPAAFITTTEQYDKSINTVVAAAWASSGDLNTARWGGSTMGSQTAGLFAGGATPSTKLNNSEEYDGTSWTEGNNLNTARGLMAAGGNSTQTAGLAFAGTTSTGPDNPGATNATEEYNGSSWTSVNNMNYSARNLGGAGTQTSAVSAGGVPVLATTGEYDGTNWTAGTSLPAGLQDNQGMTGASQTAAFVAGGEGPPGARRTDTLEYDGTNWTAGGPLFTAVMQNGASGTLTAGLTFGGSTPAGGVTTTLGYDGTSWSTRPSMATARQYAHGAGTNVATFVAGGLGPPGGAITTTEDFTGETLTANIADFTTS